MVEVAGGILALLSLIDDEERRSCLEYDFRTRFHVGVDELPERMGYDEAARLVRRLRADPSSALAANMEGWDYPVSRAETLLMDLWDLGAHHTYKKPKPYPRPWKPVRPTAQRGNAAGRTADEVKAILRERFGQPDAPV